MGAGGTIRGTGGCWWLELARNRVLVGRKLVLVGAGGPKHLAGVSRRVATARNEVLVGPDAWLRVLVSGHAWLGSKRGVGGWLRREGGARKGVSEG